MLEKDEIYHKVEECRRHIRHAIGISEDEAIDESLDEALGELEEIESALTD